MKQFESRVTYYIHEYKAISDWFGNRGYPIKRSHIREWCYDGHFLYYRVTDKADRSIQPTENIDDVVVVQLTCMYYEPEFDVSYEKSPFARKINGE